MLQQIQSASMEYHGAGVSQQLAHTCCFLSITATGPRLQRVSPTTRRSVRRVRKDGSLDHSLTGTAQVLSSVQVPMQPCRETWCCYIPPGVRQTVAASAAAGRGFVGHTSGSLQLRLAELNMSLTMEDSQQGGYVTSILVEKRLRKLAEDDAIRLYARVKQLQKEEEKALKRIQDTKKKAKEIIRYRERNELQRQEKEQRLREQVLAIERQKAENIKAREETVKNRVEQENRVWENKYYTAQQTKEEKAEIGKLLLESRLLSRKEAMEQKEAVKKAQEEARKRIEQLKMNRLQMAQEEYERRLREEMEAKEAKEAEIERLAQVELQLIERLKHKQQEQRKAYQQLEAVLKLGSSTSPKASKQHSPRAGSPGLGPSSSQQSDAPPGEPSDEDVARAFSIYDDDAIGEITTTSLDPLLRDLGVVLNATQLGQAIAQLDTSQTGRITFGEFLLWWRG